MCVRWTTSTLTSIITGKENIWQAVIRWKQMFDTFLEALTDQTWRGQTASLRRFLSFCRWNGTAEHKQCLCDSPCVGGIQWTLIADNCMSRWVFEVRRVVMRSPPFTDSHCWEDNTGETKQGDVKYMAIVIRVMETQVKSKHAWPQLVATLREVMSSSNNHTLQPPLVLYRISSESCCFHACDFKIHGHQQEDSKNLWDQEEWEQENQNYCVPSFLDKSSSL